MTDLVAINTAGPPARCDMCGGRARFEPPRAIHCGRCCWTSLDNRHAGRVQRLRVALAVPAVKWWLYWSPLSGVWGAWYRLRARMAHRFGGHVFPYRGGLNDRCSWCGEARAR